MDDPKAIGARIREARNRKGLTQVDLAAAIGVSRSHLTNVEGGNGSLALDKLSVLASETGTTVAWLIGEIGPLDQVRADWLAAFEYLDQRDREALLRAAEGLRRSDPPAVAPPTNGPPHRPFLGRSVEENKTDCGRVVRITRVPA